MIRQAREMIQAGDLGELLAVRVSYVQGWMHGMDANRTPPRGAWKSDPEKNGRAGSLGDVGTHAFHLLRFVTSLQPETLLSRMSSYSSHHQLDDYGHAIIRFDQGSTGLVTWSQVTHGRLNDLAIEVDGTKASLAWRQEEPNQLVVRALGEPTKVYERNPNAGYSTSAATAACRLPGGHPEAFFEAFANVYRDAFQAMRNVIGEPPTSDRTLLYPTVQDGLEGVRFMEACLASHDRDSSWFRW
jgi:predicted dehydrogenase